MVPGYTGKPLFFSEETLEVHFKRIFRNPAREVGRIATTIALRGGFIQL